MAAAGSKLASPVTERDLAAIVALNKSVLGRTTWFAKSNAAWSFTEWKVRHDLVGVSIRLLASVNLRSPDKFTTSLLMNDIRVAGICVRTPHSNKHTDDIRFGWDTHEHVWTDACNATWCRPMEIEPQTIYDTVLALAHAFGVNFNADWKDPPLSFQETLVKL